METTKKEGQPMRQPTDRDVARTMEEYGGSFVSRLGHTALAADPVNLKKIRDTWPDYWAHYTRLAQSNLEDEQSPSQ